MALPWPVLLFTHRVLNIVSPCELCSGETGTIPIRVAFAHCLLHTLSHCSKKPPFHPCFGDPPVPPMSQTPLQRGNLFKEASLATSTCCKGCQPSHCNHSLQLMSNQLLTTGVDIPVALHLDCNLGAWCLHSPLLQRGRCHSDVPRWHRAAC